MAVLTVGDDFPQYDSQTAVGGVFTNLPVNQRGDYFRRVNSADVKKDQWRLVVIWPKDFTSVCPTEPAGIAEIYNGLKKRNYGVVTVNTDSEYIHLAWYSKDKLLRSIPFPLTTDPKRDSLKTVGVLNIGGVCDRASFPVGPNDKIQSICIDIDSVERSAKKLLRQLDVLQSEGLTSCEWHPDEPTLDMFKTTTNLVSLNL